MDIKELLDGTVNSLDINNSFIIPKEYYINTEIKDLSNIKVEGKLINLNNNLQLDVKCSGTMKIADAVSMQPVDYKFHFEIKEDIEEKIEKEKFTLDIISILWENIVLEVPIRYSEVNSYDEYQGDGWRVISEDDFKKNTNNPFKELLNEKKKE